MRPEAYRIMQDMEDSHWWFRARGKIICDKVTKWVRPGSDVLDFGCGAGGIASKLSRLGYNVVAADSAPQALVACQARGLTTLDLRCEWPADESADCVLACDVIEHVEDDAALLAKLRRVLRPTGILLLTVPAYQFLWSGEDYVSKHFRRYARSSLARSLRTAGYEMMWCSYFNSLLFPIIMAAIFGKRVFRPRDMYESNVSELPRWQNEMLYGIFASEGHLLRWIRFPAGASLIAIAQQDNRRTNTI